MHASTASRVRLSLGAAASAAMPTRHMRANSSGFLWVKTPRRRSTGSAARTASAADVGGESTLGSAAGDSLPASEVLEAAAGNAATAVAAAAPRIAALGESGA